MRQTDTPRETGKPRARRHATPARSIRALAAASIAAALLTFGLAGAPAAIAAPAGQVYAAGWNYYGELADGNATGGGCECESTFRANPLLPPTVVQASPGYYATLFLMANGTVEGSGYNGDGELATPPYQVGHATPVTIPGVTSATAVAEGAYHSLALLSDGTVDAWGYNANGELGNGTVASTGCDCGETPGRVEGIGGSGALSHVVAISAGEEHSLALLTNGTVVAWGYNAHGELGNGAASTTGCMCSDTPVQVVGVGGTGTLSNVVAISAGGLFNLALLSDGTVVAWGYNTNGQLGDGETSATGCDCVPYPVQVKGVGGSGTLSGVAAVSAGYNHGTALLSNGTAVAWGENQYGQLGDGEASTTGCRCVDAPAQVKGIGGSGALSGIASISAGADFNLAVLASGTLAGWGYGYYGELGNGTVEGPSVNTPVAIPGVRGVLSIGHGDFNYGSLVVVGASAALSTQSVAFGNEPPGGHSAAQTVTLTNNGPAALAVSGDALTGSAAFTKGADTCQGATLAAGAACAVSLTFSPTAAGAASATLAFSTTATNALSAVSLSGTGVAAAAPAAPVLGNLSLSPHAFRAAKSGASVTAARTDGTIVSYTDSAAATTTFSVQQARRGILRGTGRRARCVAAPRHPRKRARKRLRRCTFTRTLGSFTHDDAAGSNRLRFTGRVHGRALKPGRYRLVAVARAAGLSSTAKSASFKIVKR